MYSTLLVNLLDTVVMLALCSSTSTVDHLYHLLLYYIVYRDFITKLIIAVSSFTITPISIYIVYRDFITTLIIGVLSFTITPISTCSLAFVSEIQKCLPEAICCHITRYLHCLQRFYHNVVHRRITLYHYTNFHI